MSFWCSALKYILLHCIIILSSDTSRIHAFEASLTSDKRAVLQKTVLPNESKWLLGAHLHLAKGRQGVGDKGCLSVESGISQLKLDFSYYKKQLKSGSLFNFYFILLNFIMINYLLHDYLSKIWFYFTRTCSILTQTK